MQAGFLNKENDPLVRNVPNDKKRKRGESLAVKLPGDGPLVAKVTSYLPCLKSCTRTILEDSIKESKQARPIRREAYVLEPPSYSSSKVSGEERLRYFENILENGFRWRRHLFQKAFHDKAVMVLAPLILGSDWDAVGPALVRQRNWPIERNSRMLLARGPRRFGKSVAVSMLAAAMALAVPNIKQAIFSTSQRVSVYLGEKIRDDIVDAGFEHRIKKFGQERMDICGPPDGDSTDIRTVSYYPANPKISDLILIASILSQSIFLMLLFFFERGIQTIGGFFGAEGFKNTHTHFDCYKDQTSQSNSFYFAHFSSPVQV
jgi:hypothetical protein